MEVSEATRDPLAIPAEVKASIRILIIDDERTLRESCASVLQADGYNVTTIGRGEEALETVRRRKFDVYPCLCRPDLELRVPLEW